MHFSMLERQVYLYMAVYNKAHTTKLVLLWFDYFILSESHMLISVTTAEQTVISSLGSLYTLITKDEPLGN